MMASGFRPVGWVAGVAASAICCYMLSLNVASERADLHKIEQQIVSTKQDIRSLQTELGTRGRMAQLEEWNSDVLALSAPTTPQFLDNEVKLARFDQTTPSFEQRAEVRMASADVAPTPAPATRIETPVLKASAPEPRTPAPSNPLIHQASLTVQTAGALTTQSIKPVKPDVPAPAKPAAAPKSTAVASARPVQPIALPAPARPIRTASADPRPGGIDSSLARQIAAAAKLEASRGAR